MKKTYEKNLKTRLTIRFPEQIADFLSSQGQKMGLSPSEMVRQIINSHFMAADILSASAKSERKTNENLRSTK